jgi:hypothetical protein
VGTQVTQSYIKLAGSLVEISPGNAKTPDVPETGYDIVIGFIQSNMRGVADDYAASDQFNSNLNVYMWNHSSSSIVPVQEPMSTAETTTGMGASNTFLKDYATQSLANGRKLLFVNVARGGTGFTTPSTNSGSTGFHWRYDLANDSNNLARRSVDVINNAVAAAGPGSRFVAFLANHGSTDGSNNTAKATFKTYLQTWINWIRNELDSTDIPYVMMQMRPSLIANETRHRIIAEAQAETATELPLTGYALAPVGAQYARNDSVHFNAAGMRIIGHNLYDEWERIKNL